jgi:catechol 2,3-dioxygenase-like lactoylglutathione lyase family enzyme
MEQPVAAFSHVGIFVRDLDRMVDFYTRVLGLLVNDRVVDLLPRSRGQSRRAVRRHALAHAAAVRGAVRYRGAG